MPLTLMISMPQRRHYYADYADYAITPLPLFSLLITLPPC
jgi:hypothetical protein